MSGSWIVLHTAVAIVGAVLLIVRARFDPVIALIVATIYLGLVGGLGFANTMDAIAEGFGTIMADVGLLIGFGVLMGSLLLSMGALQRLVALLLGALGPRKLPYAFAAALSAVFPAIYVDVQLVLAAPLARSAARRMPGHGTAMMGGALTAGILVGYVFVVPGLATVTIAGLLDVPLGTMLLYGFVLGPVTAVLTTFVYGQLLRRGLWNEDRDEVDATATADASAPEPSAQAAVEPTPATEPDAATEPGAAVGPDAAGRRIPLAVSLLPVLVPLLLIAAGAVVDALGVESAVVTFVGDPAFALFVGLLGAYLLARRTLGRAQVGEALNRGFSSTGQILLITGIGGSLGEVIGKTGLEDVLAGLFSAEAGTPVLVAVLLTWTIAALLHIAIGSISVAAITAAGILAPILPGLGVPAAVIGLAIGSGALFALNVNSNFFWMFQTLLGVTTRGALKALTLVTSLASVISLVIVSGLALVL
ncbi:GntP family permease [Pseudonocardia sp. KRD291]|uniref:GntP family permease n=1 Tax=Pseudonocardia sp. KRD291 TaxID=2792007 RepID=UPI001C4A2469|nr:GntP family permease [Pseudonocardia sp. KRD291]MBW0101465.1 GntP family permease [Pseudonocardia sp. KRD291]